MTTDPLPKRVFDLDLEHRPQCGGGQPTWK